MSSVGFYAVALHAKRPETKYRWIFSILPRLRQNVSNTSLSRVKLLIFSILYCDSHGRVMTSVETNSTLFFSGVSSTQCSFSSAQNCCIRPAPTFQCNSFGGGVVAAFYGFCSVALFYDISKSSMLSRRSLSLFPLVRARLWISQPICLSVCMAGGVCKCVKKILFRHLLLLLFSLKTQVARTTRSRCFIF